MARIVFARSAGADLERIVDHLLEQSPEAASRAITRVRSAIDVLQEHPLIGRRVHGELRELVISHGSAGYLALYRFEPAADVVLILCVRHQREAGYYDLA